MSETMLTENRTTVLDERYARAIILDKEIEHYAQQTMENLYRMCKCMSEMKEFGLYSELGFKDFDDYIEKRHNIKSRQAYKYISIVNKFSEEEIKKLSPGAKSIGVSKLSLLASLTREEREEVTAQTDVASASKRELEQKIKEIKLLKKDLERAEAECDTLTENCDQLKMDLGDAAKDIDKLQKENDKLKRNVEELENRPIDVAVKENDEELEKLRKAVKATEKEKTDLDKKYKERMTELSELDKQHKAEIDKLSAEYEEKLKQAKKIAEEAKPQTESDPKEAFKAYYTIAYKAFGTLLTFSKEQPEEYKDLFLGKITKLAESLKDSVSKE